MSTLTVTLPTGATVCNGKQVTFRAPCNCTGVTGIIISGTTYSLVDANNNSISSNGTQFTSGAMVSVIMDTENKRAYIQNTGAHKHTKSDISDFPTTMTPSAHTHTKSEITDFPTTMTPSAHTHKKSEITDFPTTMTPSAHTHTKSEITDFPTTMTPSAHNQAASTITAGTLAGKVQANATAAATLSNAQVRDIKASTTDLTAGSSSLTTGTLYLVYE